MKRLLSIGALLLGSALVHVPAAAQQAVWSFTYTGFYDREAHAFLPDMRLSGSFSGTDGNGDGLLELGELSTLMVGATDFISCAAASNAFYHCGADRFRFSPGTGLSFSLGEYGSDPEGWVGGGHLVETGALSYEYRFDPYSSYERHLEWTNDTRLTLVSVVPEPAAWGLLGAGLAAIGLWRRRRP